MTMIERVAAVLQQQMSKVSSGTRTYDDIARKVLLAMREPSMGERDKQVWNEIIERALDD